MCECGFRNALQESSKAEIASMPLCSWLDSIMCFGTYFMSHGSCACCLAYDHTAVKEQDVEGLHGLFNTEGCTLVRHAHHCRQALEEEADILCLLAKVERSGLSFASAVTTADVASNDKNGSITVVVQEGLEVLLPMAGMLFWASLLATSIA